MTDSHKPDTLYRAPLGGIRPFVFDEQVADVFPDMIRRSVPGYAETLSVISTVTAESALDGSRLYDLGCSLGAAALVMRHAVPDRGCEIVAVDNSTAMVHRCRQLIARDSGTVPVTVLEQDLMSTTIERGSVIVMNYTLQFVPVETRRDLVHKLSAGLLPGGVLLLSEKITLEDPVENAVMTAMHRRFKLLNGYDDMEIAQKRAALENVLISETLATHRNRLLAAGFSRVLIVLRFFNFVTLLAVKPGRDAD